MKEIKGYLAKVANGEKYGKKKDIYFFTFMIDLELDLRKYYLNTLPLKIKRKIENIFLKYRSEYEEFVEKNLNINLGFTTYYLKHSAYLFTPKKPSITRKITKYAKSLNFD